MYKEAANTHIANDIESKLAEPSWNRLIGVINAVITIKGAGYNKSAQPSKARVAVKEKKRAR